MREININISGLEETMKKFKKISEEAIVNADHIAETYAFKMAEEAAADAPVDSGYLSIALAASPEQLEEGLWQFGNNGVEYTRRQEYEHATKKGFIRKAVWNNRREYREALREEMSEWK